MSFVAKALLVESLMAFSWSRWYAEHQVVRDQGGAEGGCAVVNAIEILARSPGGMRWQWGHKKTTIVPFCGSTKKVEGVLAAVHPTSFLATFKHPNEKNVNWNSSGECELYAPRD